MRDIQKLTVAALILIVGLVGLAPTASAFDLNDAKDRRDERIEEVKDAEAELHDATADYCESAGRRSVCDQVHATYLFSRVRVTRAILEARNEVLFADYRYSHGIEENEKAEYETALSEFNNVVP